jgi:signal transduction histidine kinase
LIAYLTRRNPFQARIQTLAPGEAVRVERVLAVARAFLAVSSLVAIWIDPTEPSRYASLAYVLMSAYAVHSLIVLVWVRASSQFSLRFLITLQGIDVLWPAVISIFTSPAGSPFFLFDAFVLLEAAYRWGFQETLATAAVEVLLYFFTSTVAVFGPAPFRVLIPGEADVNRMIMRPLYLAIMAYLLGYLGEQEKVQRAEASCIARVIGKIRAEMGLRGALREVFEETLQTFGSKRGLLIVCEKNTERIFLWESARESPLSQLALRWSEPEASVRSDFMFDAPGGVWFVRRTQQGSGLDKDSVEVLDEDRPSFHKIRWSPPGVLLERYPFDSALGVEVDAGAEWAGSWWLFDPDCGSQPQEAATFLRTLARQLFPAIHGVFVMRRLRSQAGAMERARVARELHDGVIQSLIGLEMQMDVLRRQSGSTPETLTRELARLQSLLHTEVLNLRELMQQMKPVEYSPKQFLDLLAQMVDKFRRDTGIVARFVSSLGEVELTTRVGSEVARILQEALVNIRRHSGAHNVLVRFDAQDGMWKLAIDDDGRGYDFSGRRSHSELDQARKGPMVIKERARSIGGEVTIESLPGHGSKLEIKFPQKKL